MCDEWMPSVRLPLSLQQFHELPRHAAYKYEYIAGSAILSPWPRHRHALLELSELPLPADPQLPVRQVHLADEPALVDLFAAAFQRIQPFGSLDDDTLRTAAQQCLRRAFTGGDGPWAAEASFVACPEDGRLTGAALVTLLPGGDFAQSSSYRWEEPPPTDLWQRAAGQPHLTWIFVSPWHKGRGIGTMLLHHVASMLRRQGYTSLWSTFLVGNDSSMLWHWRHGFRLAR